MDDFQPNQDICLVPYYPAYEIALPWYQDAELCHHVDNQNRIYDLSILKNMYQYLSSHGDLFYIEYKGILCGDVCLQTSGEISIVVCKEYQNRHIGKILHWQKRRSIRDAMQKFIPSTSSPAKCLKV